MSNDKMKNKQKRKGGRKPKKHPAIYRYSISLNVVEHEKFLALYEQSGMKTKAHFIVKRIFDEPFKVIHIDKPSVDYYAKLTSFYSQFRAIGVNYNQVVRAINTHLTPKKALAFLYKLEKATLELVAVIRNVIALTKDFEEKHIKMSLNKTKDNDSNGC